MKIRDYIEIPIAVVLVVAMIGFFGFVLHKTKIKNEPTYTVILNPNTPQELVVTNAIRVLPGDNMVSFRVDGKREYHSCKFIVRENP